MNKASPGEKGDVVGKKRIEKFSYGGGGEDGGGMWGSRVMNFLRLRGGPTGSESDKVGQYGRRVYCSGLTREGNGGKLVSN